MGKKISHALVRCKNNNLTNKTQILPIKQVKAYKAGILKPKHGDDFNRKKPYAVKPNVHKKYEYAEICKLGGENTLKQLSKKRVVVQKLNMSDADESLSEIPTPPSTSVSAQNNLTKQMQLLQKKGENEKSIVHKKVSENQNKNSHEATEEHLQSALQKAIANVPDMYRDNSEEEVHHSPTAVDAQSKTDGNLDDGMEGGKNGESDEESMITPQKKKPIKSARKTIVNTPEYIENENSSDDSIDEAFKNIPTSNQLHSKDLSDLQGVCATGRKIGQIWMKRITHKGKMKSIEMVHLSRGVSIPLQNWRITTANSKTRSIFVKKMSRNLWGPERLANRCVDYSSKCQKVTRDSPRKQLTPKKMKVLKHCYHAFLTNIKPSLVGEREDMATVLSEITSILSEEIGTQIKNFKAGSTAKTPLCVEEPYDGDESDDSLIYEEDSLVYEED